VLLVGLPVVIVALAIPALPYTVGAIVHAVSWVGRRRRWQQLHEQQRHHALGPA
jgi:hypothetical protein